MRLLQGHSGWVTSLTTSPESPDILLSGSRGNYQLTQNIIKR